MQMLAPTDSMDRIDHARGRLAVLSSHLLGAGMEGADLLSSPLLCVRCCTCTTLVSCRRGQRRPRVPPPPGACTPVIPLISGLYMQGGVCIEPGFFAVHQDFVVCGVAHFLDVAGKLVFDDRLHVLLRRSETGLMVNTPKLMAPYTSQPVAVPEDCRSMFITFSKGNALHREDIVQYFRQQAMHTSLKEIAQCSSSG
ncbi:uncharacterized protein LOC123396131 isoform X2 [Hordeum vulgare subsp. vulgare]|uniref:uncharacterized protein LOC123396131 isoform X2 n=1 Tax=Hordeum vulgare subsp. vulgare TaxID=112509 RepID=UPI001D1A572E|nr:uncharacterized protein LOC123396131 isoform X2 [Hordeum vulgare subsp. vulgare]